MGSEWKSVKSWRILGPSWLKLRSRTIIPQGRPGWRVRGATTSRFRVGQCPRVHTGGESIVVWRCRIGGDGGRLKRGDETVIPYL